MDSKMQDPVLREGLLQLFRQTHRPHRLFKTMDGALWEFISYPWIEGNKMLVNVRKPGDPTTLTTMDVLDCDPEHAQIITGKAETFIGGNGAACRAGRHDLRGVHGTKTGWSGWHCRPKWPMRLPGNAKRLLARARSKAAKAIAQARKDRGEKPGFMKGKIS